MASVTNISGNSYVLDLGAAESVPLFSLDLSTGEVASSYFDAPGRLAIQTSLAPLLATLSSPEEAAGIQPILLSCVSVAPINGAVNLSVSSVGSVYSLNVGSVAAVKSRVTIAHTVQGGFVGGVPQGGSSGVAPNYNLQVFSSSGTWTKPAGAQNVKVFLLGAGGGGGSGRSAANGASRFGGGSGAGGAGYLVDFRAQDLTATVPVTIGAGGIGGAPAVNANGNPGQTCGKTQFGTYLLDGALFAFGNGGTSGSGVGGSSGPSGRGGALGWPNTGGISASAGVPVTGFVGVGLQAAASGSGGTIAFLSGVDTTFGGGVGASSAWVYRNIDPTAGAEAGAGGAAGTGASGGNPPAATVPSILAPFGIALRSGGGGGGSGDLAGTVPGGAGWSAGPTDYGVGGGGGGASTNPQPSGAGGNGGPGVVAVLSW
jgi:hypothetical protein